MIQPIIKDQPFIDDVRRAAAEPGARLWWLGQSGFLLQWNRRHLLFDPYLSDSLTRKYAGTDKPHVRMTELIVDPARLNFIDVATSSHNHTDHLDGDTLTALLRVNPAIRIVVPEANLAFAAERLRCDRSRLIGVDAGGAVESCGFTIHAVPAAHEQVDRDEQGRCIYLGYVVTFGPYAVYHSGDTVRYDGMVEALRPFRIDAALLPINGSLPQRRVAGNLWGREAAQLAKDIRAAVVVPCHYDMFQFNTVTPDEFVDTCQAIGQPYRILKCGERLAIGR